MRLGSFAAIISLYLVILHMTANVLASSRYIAGSEKFGTMSRCVTNLFLVYFYNVCDVELIAIITGTALRQLASSLQPTFRTVKSRRYMIYM